VAEGHQMGAHFTNHSPQLGVLVKFGVIVNADQDVFDEFGMIGCVRLGSIARHGLQPRRL
jgi:hypothetical protein